MEAQTWLTSRHYPACCSATPASSGIGRRSARRTAGIWQTWTWRQYHDQVRDLALGLAALGFQRGDRLSVIGDNRPRLYWGQVAAQALGGVPVPVYQDSIAKELAYVWNHSEVSVILAEDQEQVDKILALRAELPALRLVIYDDPRGISSYRHDWLKSYDDLQERGRALRGRASRVFRGRDREGAAGRRRDHLLHLGHHRQSEGGHDHARQRGRGGRQLPAGVSPHPGGHLAGLPAHGVGRRFGLHAVRQPGGGLLRQLPGEPGDGAAGPPGARARPRCWPRPASGRTCSPRCRCGPATPLR